MSEHVGWRNARGAGRQLRVLQIRSHFEDNGPGTQALTIARELERRGHDVFFASAGGTLATLAQSQGFAHFTIRALAREKRTPLRFLSGAWAVASLFRNLGIDVAHAHNAATALAAHLAWRMARRSGHTVHSVRGVELRKTHQWRNWIYRGYPVHMLAVCEYTRRTLIDLGARPGRVTVTFNGVDLERFRPSSADEQAIRRELSLGERVVVGHVGSMAQTAKGQDVLIRAVAAIRERAPELSVVLVGDGKFRGKFESVAAECGVQDRVVFAGRRFDIPAFQMAFDIYSQPSVHGEMFPNAILEAMAMGNPWVGSEIAGLPEMTAQGRAGIVVPPGDVDALGSVLLELYRSPARRARMGAAGLAEVRKKYAIESVVDRIEAVYHSV